ncbi:MAG: T9SS type A sorting domain-containing protein [Bacteroidia bacterium]|nr:T9SS type A sorting domain-containing protein [Bacteroidia bacterium]
MKKILLCVSVLFIAICSNAQVTFQKSYGEFFVDMGQSMVQTNDGGFCIVGMTGPDLADSSDILVIRTDAEGSQIWSARLAGPKDDIITDIVQTNDGGFLLVGNTFSSPTDTAFSDIIAIKIDDGGFVYWSKTFGGTDYEEAQSVVNTNDGGYVILGSTMSYGSVDQSAFAMKIDDSGNQVWTNTSSTFSSNYFYGADQTNDGKYIAAGGTYNAVGATDFDHYITKLDTNGSILWSKSHGTTQADFLYDISSTANGSYLAAGISYGNTVGSADMNVLKLDANGDVIWSFNYGTVEYDNASSVLELANGDILVCGYTNIGTSMNVVNQMALMKLDSAGAMLWSMTYGDISLTSEAYKALPTSDGYALCGFSVGFDPLGDSYLVKTDGVGESGCYNQPIVYTRTASTMTSNLGFSELIGFIDEFPTPFIPVTFTNQFSQICFSVSVGENELSNRFDVYPNPAKSFIKVVPGDEMTSGSITIYDVTGRTVRQLEFSNQKEILIDLKDMNAGMYMLSIITDEGVATKTFVRE